MGRGFEHTLTRPSEQMLTGLHTQTELISTYVSALDVTAPKVFEREDFKKALAGVHDIMKWGVVKTKKVAVFLFRGFGRGAMRDPL